MTPLDTKILGLLIKDGRASFAEIARTLKISRAHVRERVQKLIDDGVIEQFTAVVNPEKLGKAVSAFFDVEVAPQGIQEVARNLAAQPEVVSLYIMNDMQSLHMRGHGDTGAVQRQSPVWQGVGAPRRLQNPDEQAEEPPWRPALVIEKARLHPD